MQDTSQPSPPRILLVGNDSATLDTVVAALRNDHITLRFARTAEQALHFFQNSPADLVLVDLESAEDEGLKVLRQFKEYPPRPADAGHCPGRR